MGLNAKKLPKGNGGPRVEQPILEPGPYPARVVQVIDLGLQPQRPYQGAEKPPTYMIQLTYELLDEFMIDEEGNVQEDKPRWVSEEFPFKSLELDQAKSTKRYYALDPECALDGDFTQLVGIPCVVTLVHGENKKDPDRPYMNVGNVSPMRPKDVAKAPELVNDPRVFTLDDPNMDVFLSFPQWLQDKIKANLEYKGSLLEKRLTGDSSASEVDPEDVEPEESDEAW